MINWSKICIFDVLFMPVSFEVRARVFSPDAVMKLVS